MAARFLAALHGLQMPPPQMTDVDAAEVAVATRLVAACVFADAWHFWHMEVYGEHAMPNAQAFELTTPSAPLSPRCHLASHPPIGRSLPGS
jgi:hypothetical protein